MTELFDRSKLTTKDDFHIRKLFFFFFLTRFVRFAVVKSFFFVVCFLILSNQIRCYCKRKPVSYIQSYLRETIALAQSPKSSQSCHAFLLKLQTTYTRTHSHPAAGAEAQYRASAGEARECRLNIYSSD